MKINLTDWTLTGWHPYVPLWGGMPVTAAIPAAVPGSVYADLQKAGVIADPYFGMNSLMCEWVAARWWRYETSVKLSPKPGRRFWLVLRGVDYKARVYLGGKEIGRHEGMYVPARFEITSLAAEGENNIAVLLEHAPDEMGQLGYTSKTHTQKARFNYKWDFSTRMIGVGLYDDAYIEETGPARIKNVHTRFDGSSLLCSAEYDLSDGERADGLELRASLCFGGEEVASASSGNGSLDLAVPSPKLWYPNGSGPQPLYDLELSLFYKEELSDLRNMKTGLRTLSYRRCIGAGEDALPYAVAVNGKDVYIKGVNTTPLDCMYGCVSRERYEKFIKLAAEANVNLIRVWGGGLIEKEDFYNLCDRYGIMVWQEFIQSSSGIDNIPSKRPEFLELLRRTAQYAVAEKRNHVCLTYWSGGNELMDASGVPSGFDDLNLSMLKNIADRLDPDRLMLPTSASGPSEGLDISRPGKNHDVHGPWKYGGEEGHYSLYNASDSMLHSEFGCDGLTNLSSIKKALPEADLRADNMTDNLMWRFHGEWWDTSERDERIFGRFATGEPKSIKRELDDFIMCSQYIQYEGIRYALEANRRREIGQLKYLSPDEAAAFRENCGSIVWQFGEPWRNVSCTCLIDYDLKPKAAYYAFREAEKGEHVSLRYDKLIWSEGEIFSASLTVHSDSGSHTGADASARILGEDGAALYGNENGAGKEVKWRIGGCGRSFTVETLLCGEVVGRYLFFVISEQFPFADREAVRREMKLIKSGDIG